MKMILRKLAVPTAPPGTQPPRAGDDGAEYTGELLGPLMEGHSVVISYWQRGRELSCGTLSTGELISRGEGVLHTTDGFYLVRFPDAEDRAGRRRVRALVPGAHRKLLRVPIHWPHLQLMRQRLQSLIADVYSLEVERLPMGKQTGFAEVLSPGVLKGMVELASFQDLENVETRMRLHHRAMSSGVKRAWLGLADLDLRGELVVFPSAVLVWQNQHPVAARRFVTIVEPDRGHLLHATDEEFPFDANSVRSWQDFWRRLHAARKLAEGSS